MQQSSSSGFEQNTELRGHDVIFAPSAFDQVFDVSDTTAVAAQGAAATGEMAAATGAGATAGTGGGR